MDRQSAASNIGKLLNEIKQLTLEIPRKSTDIHQPYDKKIFHALF